MLTAIFGGSALMKLVNSAARDENQRIVGCKWPEYQTERRRLDHNAWLLDFQLSYLRLNRDHVHHLPRSLPTLKHYVVSDGNYFSTQIVHGAT